jgi:hypothetical protein
MIETTKRNQKTKVERPSPCALPSANMLITGKARKTRAFNQITMRKQLDLENTFVIHGRTNRLNRNCTIALADVIVPTVVMGRPQPPREISVNATRGINRSPPKPRSC